MNTSYRIRENKRLRTGVTTGSCAAAAAKAAAQMLLSGQSRQTVQITTRDGTSLTLPVSDISREENRVNCSVTKDAGDDPDVTDGIRIFAEVCRLEPANGPENDIVINGGEGIGRVTKPGLKIAVGEAAINPAPLEQIRTELKKVCGEFGYAGGLRVVIYAPEGAAVAKKTMNERLGIMGGISILGTTGIVEPMSDKAIIDTIRTEIDMHVAQGRKKIVVTPGSYGKDFAKDELGIDIKHAVKCSNFIGETLDYAELVGIEHILLVGHVGKLVKIAGGIMNTYSKVADCRMEIMAAHCAMCGIKAEQIRELMECVTVDATIDLIKQWGNHEQVWQSIEKKITFHLRERTRGNVHVTYIVFTHEHGILIHGDTRV